MSVDDVLPSEPDESPAKPRRRRRLLLTSALVGVGLVLGLAAWLGVEAWSARGDLEAAAAEVGALEQQVRAGDAEGAEATLASLQEHAAAAHAATDGPLWALAARVPGVGPSVEGVATVAAVVDSLAQDALPQLAQARAAVSPSALTPVDGRIDLQPIVDVAPAVVAADRAVQGARERLAALEPERMVGVVAGPVEDLAARVDEVAMTTATASRAVQLLPPMLGADGPRTYAVLVQSNAELRSTGGAPGVYLILSAEDGLVALERHIVGNTLYFDPPVVDLNEEELDAYTEIMAMFGLNPTMTPDFPRAAEIARAMVEGSTGIAVDGVLALDPVVLQGVLAVTGPVTTPSGRVLDGANAAEFLLNGIYLQERDPALQDMFFAEAGAAVFDRLATMTADASALVNVLAQSASEGRLLVWSARSAEQALLSGTVLSGELTGEQGDSPVIGVYLNDGSGAKMDYYLEYAVVLTPVGCADDGSRAFRLTIDMRSTAPDDAATKLPAYVTGGGFVVSGSIQTNVAVYAPTGGWIDSVETGGEFDGIAPLVHNGLDLGMQTVDLEPGESQTLSMIIVTGVDHKGPVRLRLTPGPHAAQVSISDFHCSG